MANEIEFDNEAEVKPGKGPSIMEFFKPIQPLQGKKKQVSDDFSVIADHMNEWLKEGTFKTALLERLLDTRDAVLREVK